MLFRHDEVGVVGLGMGPAALVFLQPDLGTGIVLVMITLAVLFVAGVSWKHFAAMGAVAAVIATLTRVLVRLFPSCLIATLPPPSLPLLVGTFSARDIVVKRSDRNCLRTCPLRSCALCPVVKI